MTKPYGEGKYFKTKSAYLNWIRGVLRRGWTKYPPQNKYKASRSTRVPVLDENGDNIYYKSGKKKGQLKTRLESPCDGCGKIFPSSKIQVDHITPVGSLTKEEHLEGYTLDMYCDEENWQLLCSETCHPIKSYADEHDLTWEEAGKMKKVILKCNQSVKDQKEELKALGYSDKDISNKEKRRKCYMEEFYE